jgi:hypothetical protein
LVRKWHTKKGLRQAGARDFPPPCRQTTAASSTVDQNTADFSLAETQKTSEELLPTFFSSAIVKLFSPLLLSFLRSFSARALKATMLFCSA